MFSFVAHYDIDTCLPFMASCGFMWSRMALSGIVWAIWLHMVLLFFTAMAIHLSIALCDLVWSCMDFYGLIWHFMAEYCLFSLS